MKLLTEDELNNKKNRFISEISDTSFNEKYDKNHRSEFSLTETNNLEPGQFFLYEKMTCPYSSELKKRETNIYYPKLAIYLDNYIVDQALEVEYKNVRRTWEHRTKYTYLYKDKEYSNYASEIQGINTTILWDEDLYVYGIWDKIPNWKELKKAYEKSIWFKRTKEELRDIKINSIING
jgi:hypothetical protein